MSQVFCPGPALFYLSDPNGAMNFLGLSEQDVRPVMQGHWRDVHTDAYGDMVPYDVQFMGTGAVISADLIQFNWPVANQVLACLNVAGQVPGAIQSQQIGSLVRLEGMAFRLCVISGYRNKTVFANANMFPGFNFNACIPSDPVDITIGTGVQRVRMGFRALPVTNFVNGSYVLWDQDFTGCPAVN